MSAPVAVVTEHEALVDSFGSALVTTEIHRSARGFRWTLRPDPVDDPRTTAARVRALTAPLPAALSVGVPGGGGWSFAAGSARSLADAALDGSVGSEWISGLHRIGAALARLHQIPAAATTAPEVGAAGPLLPAPAWPRRLDDWLHGLSPDFTAAHLAPAVRDLVGPPVWATLRQWSRELRTAPVQGICHGRPGLGLVLGPPENAVLLTGPDVAAGPVAADLGHLVGDLLELSARPDAPTTVLRAALDALVRGYGRALDAADHRAAVLRIAVHQHDYISHHRARTVGTGAALAETASTWQLIAALVSATDSPPSPNPPSPNPPPPGPPSPSHREQS